MRIKYPVQEIFFRQIRIALILLLFCLHTVMFDGHCESGVMLFSNFFKHPLKRSSTIVAAFHAISCQKKKKKTTNVTKRIASRLLSADVYLQSGWSGVSLQTSVFLIGFLPLSECQHFLSFAVRFTIEL